MQIFSVDATMDFFMKFQLFFAHENMKKTPSKVAHNLPKFSVLPTGPKPAQISISVP